MTCIRASVCTNFDMFISTVNKFIDHRLKTYTVWFLLVRRDKAARCEEQSTLLSIVCEYGAQWTCTRLAAYRFCAPRASRVARVQAVTSTYASSAPPPALPVARRRSSLTISWAA